MMRRTRRPKGPYANHTSRGTRLSSQVATSSSCEVSAQSRSAFFNKDIVSPHSFGLARWTLSCLGCDSSSTLGNIVCEILPQTVG
jgi:hypothetical protein